MRVRQTNPINVEMLRPCDPRDELPRVLLVDGRAWIVSSSSRSNDDYTARCYAADNIEQWTTFAFQLPERTTE